MTRSPRLRLAKTSPPASTRQNPRFVNSRRCRQDKFQVCLLACRKPAPLLHNAAPPACPYHAHQSWSTILEIRHDCGNRRGPVPMFQTDRLFSTFLCELLAVIVSLQVNASSPLLPGTFLSSWPPWIARLERMPLCCWRVFRGDEGCARMCSTRLGDRLPHLCFAGIVPFPFCNGMPCCVPLVGR